MPVLGVSHFTSMSSMGSHSKFLKLPSTKFRPRCGVPLCEDSHYLDILTSLAEDNAATYTFRVDPNRDVTSSLCKSSQHR